MRDFWDYVVGMEEGPFHFKLVLVPLKSDAKENADIVNIDASRLNKLREKLVELNAKDVKEYSHFGPSKKFAPRDAEKIHMIFTFETKTEAWNYIGYISDQKNYSGYIFPSFKKYFLRPGKLIIFSFI